MLSKKSGWIHWTYIFYSLEQVPGTEAHFSSEAALSTWWYPQQAEITLQTGEDAKKFGTLKSDVLTLSLIAAIVKYSEEDTHSPLSMWT